MTNFALLQTNIAFDDPKANYENVRKLFASAMAKTPRPCICQGKVDTKRHHSFRSPVRSCTELGFYSPEWLQVARNYSNEHTRREVWEHP